MLNLHQLVDSIAGQIPDSLASPAALERLSALPMGPQAFGWAGLECRLTGEPSQVDFMACLDASMGARRVLRGHTQDLGAVVEVWSAAHSELARFVPYLWLEFDLPERDRPAHPLVFLKLGSERHPTTCAHVLAAAHVLVGKEHTLGRLQRGIEALPTGARVMHLTHLGPRGLAQPRLIALVPSESLQAWLQAIGWRGARRELGELVDWLNPWSSHVSVAINLGEDMDEWIGIELSLPTRASEDPRWKASIGGLVDAELCTRERAVALREWDRGEPRCQSRGLQVKASLYGSELAAKAYLAYRPLPTAGS